MSTSLDGRRRDGVAAFVRAVRTGEGSATAYLATFLTPDAVFRSGANEFAGRDAVTTRLTGDWPLTTVYEKGSWSEPALTAAGARVTASFPGLGAALQSYAAEFTFAGDAIARIDETVTPYPKPEAQATIPPAVRAAIDTALANGTPMTVGYADDEGGVVLSLRGSIHVAGPAELALWSRSPESGLVKAVRAGKPLSFLYRNSPKRATYIIRGRAEIVAEPVARERIFQGTSEVEQNHDPERKGAAIRVHVTRLQGTSPDGPVLVVP